MNAYELSRNWFDWCFENPEKINPNHSAMYFFIIEHCNRLGWKEKFGLPMQMTKDAIGISNYRTFSKTFNDLVDWGFIVLHKKAVNQHSSNVVALAKNAKAKSKALDKAMLMHSQKQVRDTVCINKQYNQEHINKETKDSVFSFEEFWSLYPKKVGKKKCEQKYDKLPSTDKQKIKDTLSNFSQYRRFEGWTHPDPLTYLNGERWNDDLGSAPKEIKYNTPSGLKPSTF